MSVNATLGYLADEELFLQERPYCLKFEAPTGLRRSNIQVDHRLQTIEDIRSRAEDFTIDKNGFTLIPFETKMTYQDFSDESKIISVYLAEAAELLQQLVGAFRVQIFEYVVGLSSWCARIENLTVADSKATQGFSNLDRGGIRA